MKGAKITFYCRNSSSSVKTYRLNKKKKKRLQEIVKKKKKKESSSIDMKKNINMDSLVPANSIY